MAMLMIIMKSVSAPDDWNKSVQLIRKLIWMPVTGNEEVAQEDPLKDRS